MGARTDFEPLSWEEAERNRRDQAAPSTALSETGSQGQWARSSGVESSSPPPSWQPAPSVLPPQEHWQLLVDRRDRLRNEIKRGKDYLKQIQADLNESRSLLEAWPTYERHCGKNPLPDLIQSVVSKERIVQFLADWLKRREEKLDAAVNQLRMCDYPGPKEPQVSQTQSQPPQP